MLLLAKTVIKGHLMYTHWLLIDLISSINSIHFQMVIGQQRPVCLCVCFNNLLLEIPYCCLFHAWSQHCRCFFTTVKTHKSKKAKRNWTICILTTPSVSNVIKNWREEKLIPWHVYFGLSWTPPIKLEVSVTKVIGQYQVLVLAKTINMVIVHLSDQPTLTSHFKCTGQTSY